jgi:hypothetical protein
MESFEEILSADGHKNSLGRSNEVYDIVKANPTRMNELFNCIYADDAWVRMRAIDTFEKLVRDNKELARPYTSVIIEDLTEKNQASIQWHLAQLFAEIELSQSQLDKVLVWLRARVSTVEVDWIVSANVMKTLFYFYEKKLIKGEDLEPLLKLQQEHKSKTIRKKADQILDNLQKEK